jgi:hypothetical protein
VSIQSGSSSRAGNLFGAVQVLQRRRHRQLWRDLAAAGSLGRALPARTDLRPCPPLATVASTRVLDRSGGCAGPREPTTLQDAIRSHLLLTMAPARNPTSIFAKGQGKLSRDVFREWRKWYGQRRYQLSSNGGGTSTSPTSGKKAHLRKERESPGRPCRKGRAHWQDQCVPKSGRQWCSPRSAKDGRWSRNVFGLPH